MLPPTCPRGVPRRFTPTLALLALTLAACDAAPCPSASVTWPGGALEVCVDVAATAQERMTGLVGRPPLGEGEGLVLAFPTVGEVCIVNEGVPTAIDAVHVGESGRVVAVTCGIAADDPTPRCHADTRWVLEVLSPGGCDVPVGAQASYDR